MFVPCGRAIDSIPQLCNAEKAFRLLAARSGKQPKTTAQDSLNSSPRRIYQFKPQSAWVSGERLAVGNNQLVDTKIKINLQDL